MKNESLAKRGLRQLRIAVPASLVPKIRLEAARRGITMGELTTQALEAIVPNDIRIVVGNKSRATGTEG